ncbi:MAG: hypothetical protein M1831_001025 [Alyxoria varia]|nr:MAG: hypothetical protein M1831_001025 [Alyxoria varia]
MPSNMVFNSASKPTFRPKPAPSRTRAARTILMVGFFVLTVIFLLRSYAYPTAQAANVDLSALLNRKQRADDHASSPRIAKVSMLYGSPPNPSYVRALKSHRAHNERWNYAMEVLQQDISGGYWNKPSYLLSLLVRELAKPPGERIEWLMWVDADLILVNPSVPLEIFLPPSSLPSISFLGNRDHVGINTGTFFLRVCPWSIRMLSKAIALPMFTDLDLGFSVDQTAMALVMNETEFHAQGETLFQPREWYNLYQFKDHWEGDVGDLLVHFPGLEADRWGWMESWLDQVERYPERLDVPLEKTKYPKEVDKFWDYFHQSLDLLAQASEYLRTDQQNSKNVLDSADAVEHVLWGTELSVPPGVHLFELYGNRTQWLQHNLTMT